MTKHTSPREHLESTWWNYYHKHKDNSYYKINAQQIAKNPILLDCLKAPEGWRFVQLDYAALEPNVLAEFSKDPCYKDIYASGKPHDVYFYVSCKLLDADGKLNETYNLANPTKETVAAAKKLYKKERTVGKVFQLMSTYKAGAAAIYRKLALAGVDITKEEVVEIRKRYWGPELFGGIAKYDTSLLSEVQQRDGWMVNGMGRPFAITEKKEKDVVNTHTQSTGHDITDLLILHTEKAALAAGIEATPVIPDYHDETIWMCREEDAPALAEIMKAAVTSVNKTINFEIPLTGEPEITSDFTGFKGPDPVDWYSLFHGEKT